MSRVASILLSDLFGQLTAPNFLIEAPPYYTGIRIKMSVTGERSKTVSSIETVQTFDYEIEETFSRIDLDFSSFTSGANGGILGVDDYSSQDNGAAQVPTGSDCYILTTEDAFIETISPGHQSIAFALPDPGAGSTVAIGIYEYDGVTDTLYGPDWVPLAPLFHHSSAPPSGERVLADRWGSLAMFPFFGGDGQYLGGVDSPPPASVAAPSSFRDLRGVQTVTVADPESGDWDSSTVSYTYEWEIL